MGVAPAVADAPEEGLVVAYAFSQASGSAVPNSAPDSGFGPATVRNLQASDWTGSALTLRGGAKTSTGNWVELPDNLLTGQESATVVAEVQASPAMLNGFHFLWNIGNESSATEYFFASLNCGSGRSPLLGLKAGGAERLVQAGSCGITANQWVNVASVVDGAAGTASLYIDGTRVAHGPMEFSPADIVDQSLNTIGRAPWPDPLFQGAISSFRVYDRALSAAEVTDVSGADAQPHAAVLQAQAQALLDGLNLVDRETSTDIDLPTASGRVTWTSSDPSVVAADGTVDAPLAGQPAVEVELTASTAVRGFTATKTITVTVLPSTESAADRAARLAARFVIPSVVESGTALPEAPAGTAVEVTAVSAGVTVGDTIVADSEEATDAQITVRVTDESTGSTVDRTFDVRILPAATTSQLLAYSRVPTSVTEANNADVALSMHLALEDGDGWTPLNENYGILFAKTSTAVPAGGTSDSIIRSLKDPHLFRLADGEFGIVATRTARGGGADGTQSSRVLFARSADLRSYQEVGMVDLGVTSGVNQPAAVYDTASDRYVVSWTSDAGAAMYTTFTDLATGAGRTAAQRGTIEATAGDAGSGIPNYATGNALPVEAGTVDALQVRFGRIANDGVAALGDVTLEEGDEFGAADLPQRVELTYDDGSDASRAIAWDAASVDAVDTSVPGTYEVTGSVKRPQYATPFADERADPSVFRYDWNGQEKFLMIATEDIYGGNINPQGGAHMPIRVADRIEDLSDEALDAGRNVEVDLLRRGDTDADGGVMTGCFWAPEYHVIAGRLSILFMPCYNGTNGQPDMWTGRASIIQLKQDAQGNDLDPAVAANWTKAQKVVRSGGGALNPSQGISLDMTYLEDSGQSYYIWQQLGALFIAKMDPANPTRLTSEPVRILVPEYAWDNTIAEGPNVVAHDGVLNLIYSGSTVGDSYTTGLATATAGEGVDLTDPAAWSKLNYPIQKSGIFNGSWQLGTGHGMWSYDEDDNLLYVFHARTDHEGLSGRDMFVRRVHWASDGLPVFDMEGDEEVAPDNRTVTVTVEVVGSPEPELDITAAVAARCVVGKVVQVLTVTNGEAFPVTVAATGAYGSKTFTSLPAGKTSSATFTSRLAAIPVGELSLTATANVGGQTVTVETDAAYPATTCG
ncbi:LamG-like jellyroll fold domain-containing protein [Microbacterium sp. CFBP9034]|uniref:LamG-like jellyroll fold domain-containing protein n=1 Tax=Microbacterium sp. CFBP9034 TaxID=3096540 RepID=UPI002A6AF133|nr:LamG-like jellyroll fold domain-containing protein [Microbacterium sp. CFBP9034]MDY0908612.1 LamG-like jellyroll fold domain-containing protein [Microbacterium sp. CFBP9034]